MKSMTILSSQHLPSPMLRFDYAIQTQISATPFDGFRRWGPYDKNQRRKTSIRCAVLYPFWATQEMRKLREAFTQGMFYFRGFQRFTHGISIQNFEAIPIQLRESTPLHEQAQAYKDVITELSVEQQYDIVFAVIPYSPRYMLESPYYTAKLELAAHGIPCQLVTAQLLRSDESLKWSLANAAMQVYAKLGNVPWVVETPNQPNDLIIGVGQRLIRSGRIGSMKRFMSFTTAYKNNGAFLTFQGIAGTGIEDDYLQQLSKAVEGGLVAHRTVQSKRGLSALDPDRVIFHTFKKVSAGEIEAIEEGIKAGSYNGQLLPYALIHIDGSNNFLSFDRDSNTFLPQSGHTVWLGPLQALLLTEGRERYDHRKLGFPSPLAVRLDSRSSLGNEDFAELFPSLISQIYGLSKVNWRGFNAAAIPVTLGYSRLIADLISSCRNPELWTAIAQSGGLRDKAWFFMTGASNTLDLRSVHDQIHNLVLSRRRGVAIWENRFETAWAGSILARHRVENRQEEIINSIKGTILGEDRITTISTPSDLAACYMMAVFLHSIGVVEDAIEYIRMAELFVQNNIFEIDQNERFHFYSTN